MPSPSVANYYIPMSNGCIYPIAEKIYHLHNIDIHRDDIYKP